MKTTEQFLSHLDNLDIKLWLDGDRLRCNAPKDALTSELKAQLQTRKEEIIHLIHKINSFSSSDREIITPVSRAENIPLSFAQQRLWFLDRLEPGNPFYNQPTALRLTGELKIDILEQSLREIIRRHEILRTTFTTVATQTVQVIESEVNFQLLVIDISNLSPTEKEAKVKQLAQQEARYPFDLEQDLLLRVKLLKCDRQEHIILFTTHHIVSDGWSTGILIQEIATLYQAFLEGEPSPLPELSIQYADFAVWQRQWLQSKAQSTQVNYWKQQLGSTLPALNLPTDYPRPTQLTYQGAAESFTLSPSLTQALKALCQKEGVTLFMLLLTAFKVLLHRYSHQEDIVVGTPIANRNRAEIEGLIGFFVNTLVLRTNLEGNPSFQELLQRVKKVTLGAYTHQDLPFEQLVEELKPERHLNCNPLFDVMFALQNTPETELRLPGLTLSSIEEESQTAKFDLSLDMFEANSGLSGVFEYSTDLFKPSTIARMAGHFQVLLEAIVTQPETPLSKLPLLTKDEKQQILFDWNENQAQYPVDKCIHTLFEEQVNQTPDAIAVIYKNQQLTYQELNIQANQLAYYLQILGVKPETLVGICVERSFEMLVGILGILKAGGAYIPIDPNYPASRINYILSDADLSLVLTQSHLTKQFSPVKTVCLDTDWQFISLESNSNLNLDLDPSDLAYCIYTSGSTGTPKGVMIQHDSLVNFVYGAVDQYEITAQERVLQFASISFDAAVEEIYPSLITGGTVILADSETFNCAEVFIAKCRELRVTVLDLPTAYWQQLVSEIVTTHLSLPESIRLVIIGGEEVNYQYVQQWQDYIDKTPQLINTYGPTEATVVTTVYSLSNQSRSRLPIGKPLPNVQVYVLNSHLQPVPIGITGELYIGGAGVARGYLNRPELTQEKFITNPLFAVGTNRDSLLLYQTGDRVRYLADGNLEFVGRIDNQVKIRGFRVELGEIEAILHQHPWVKEAVVVARKRPDNSKQLVAYLIPTEDSGDRLIAELRHELEAKLPKYAIPSSFTVLEEFPVTPSGKVDRLTLPAPLPVTDETIYSEPITAIEKQLVSIWQEVLGVERVGIHDNFFELGGDSIISLQVISKAHQVGIHLTAKQLFQYQTIAQLEIVASSKNISTAEQGLVTGSFPLIPIQRWFFEENFANPHHWNQAVLLNVPSDIDAVILQKAIAQLIAHHDLLRTQFKQVEFQWQPYIAAESNPECFTQIDFDPLPQDKVQSTIEATAEDIQASLNLSTGQIFRAVLLNLGSNSHNRLLIVIHHLVVDGVSWRILLEDLQNIYNSLKNNQILQLPAKTTSFSQWTERLTSYARSPELRSELDYWLTILKQPFTSLPLDYPAGKNSKALTEAISVALNPEETQTLLQEIPATYQTQINDVLVTALVKTFAQWVGGQTLLFDLEGHGREALFEDVDLSRTVGWFTSIFPVLLNLDGIEHLGEALKAIKEQLRAIPNHGIGYGILRYLSRESEIIESLSSLPQAQVIFNYLGQFEGILTKSSAFTVASESSGNEQSQINHRSHVLEIDSMIIDGCLQLNWTYSCNLHRKSTIESLAQSYLANLRSLILHCQSPDAGGFTPSDFAEFKRSKWDRDDLEAITAAIKGGT